MLLLEQTRPFALPSSPSTRNTSQARLFPCTALLVGDWSNKLALRVVTQPLRKSCPSIFQSQEKKKNQHHSELLKSKKHDMTKTSTWCSIQREPPLWVLCSPIPLPRGGKCATCDTWCNQLVKISAFSRSRADDRSISPLSPAKDRQDGNQRTRKSLALSAPPKYELRHHCIPVAIIHTVPRPSLRRIEKGLESGNLNLFFCVVFIRTVV